jgi:hypothetical protein
MLRARGPTGPVARTDLPLRARRGAPDRPICSPLGECLTWASDASRLPAEAGGGLSQWESRSAVLLEVWLWMIR